MNTGVPMNGPSDTIRNNFTALLEVERWYKDRPKEYYAYVGEHNGWRVLTTWTDIVLGAVYAGPVYSDNFGGLRRSIRVRGKNGVIYYGTWYCEYDYCRIKAYKNQEEMRRNFGLYGKEIRH